MAAVSLFDLLEFSEAPAPEIRLSCDHPALSTGPDNLVHAAARLLRERIEAQPDDPRFLTTVRGFGYRFEAQT